MKLFVSSDYCRQIIVNFLARACTNYRDDCALDCKVGAIIGTGRADENSIISARRTDTNSVISAPALIKILTLTETLTPTLTLTS